MRQSCGSCASGHVGCVVTPMGGKPCHWCPVSPGWHAVEKWPSRADGISGALAASLHFPFSPFPQCVASSYNLQSMSCK